MRILRHAGSGDTCEKAESKVFVFCFEYVVEIGKLIPDSYKMLISHVLYQWIIIFIDKHYSFLAIFSPDAFYKGGQII